MLKTIPRDLCFLGDISLNQFEMFIGNGRPLYDDYKGIGGVDTCLGKHHKPKKSNSIFEFVYLIFKFVLFYNE